MTALPIVLCCLLAQSINHPHDYEGGPLDPWGAADIGMTVKVSRTRISKETRTQEFYGMVLFERSDKHIQIGEVLQGGQKFRATRTRDVPGSFNIEPEQVIETKTATETITVAGKKLECTVTSVRFKELDGDDQETLKVWHSNQVPGGVAKFERLRPADPIDAEKRTAGEVTKWDESITLDNKKVACCVFTTRRGEGKVEAWHSDGVPGKVARILTEKFGAREEWSILETTPAKRK